MGVIYFAINYNLWECSNGHMNVGRKNKCIICGSDIVNNYSRIVGFLTNVKNWIKNAEKLIIQGISKADNWTNKYYNFLKIYKYLLQNTQ